MEKYQQQSQNPVDLTQEEEQEDDDDCVNEADIKTNFVDLMKLRKDREFIETEIINYEVAKVPYWTQTKFPWTDKLLPILKEKFGYAGFRMNQVSRCYTI